MLRHGVACATSDDDHSSECARTSKEEGDTRRQCVGKAREEQTDRRTASLPIYCCT
ncbi:hypothetical protein PVAG01_01704 [Phlyctema vagabunda]|uniref:Uncharacterized protein n=1 Tax=Phlyctema vagabunda TaxID=108571 RepID=A0ABR4PYA8_9HELO